MQKKNITASMKGLDEEARTVEWVISTSTPDRVKDSLKAGGCIYDHYMRNPVVLKDHRYTVDSIVARNIDIRIAENEVVAVSQFPPEGSIEASDKVFDKIKMRLINAVSVGFQPKKYFRNDAGGYDIEEWELLEYSVVAVPCNPEAVSTGGKALETKELRSMVREVVEEVLGKQKTGVIEDILNGMEIGEE